MVVKWNILFGTLEDVQTKQFQFEKITNRTKKERKKERQRPTVVCAHRIKTKVLFSNPSSRHFTGSRLGWCVLRPNQKYFRCTKRGILIKLERPFTTHRKPLFRREKDLHIRRRRRRLSLSLYFCGVKTSQLHFQRLRSRISCFFAFLLYSFETIFFWLHQSSSLPSSHVISCIKILQVKDSLGASKQTYNKLLLLYRQQQM